MLAKEAIENGYSVDWHQSVKSTNLLALSLARSLSSNRDNNTLDRLWIVAEEQTLGRARRGRTWFSPKGNLYATLLLTKNLASDSISTLSFVAGISIAEAIHEVISRFGITHEVDIKLKWPNDLLLNQAKASGILLEVETSNEGNPVLAIGMGVNITRRPDNGSYPTMSLSEIGVNCTAQVLFKWLSIYWSRNFDLWLQSNGAELIRKKWLSHAAGLGQEIRITNGKDETVGIFETIDEQFRCVIREAPAKKVTVASGDVFFGNIATLTI